MRLFYITNVSSSFRCLVCLFLALYGSFSGGEEIDDHCLALLVQFAYRTEVKRSQDSLRSWLQYKNGPNPDPRVVNLTDPGLDRTVKMPSDQHVWLWDLTHGATAYEREVLMLRQGDRVVFHGRSFLLGEFLGAGNTTHIFRLPELPGLVIRIPFSVADLIAKAQPDRRNLSPEERIAHIRFRVKQFLLAISRQEGGVTVIEKDGKDYSYAVVTEVMGTRRGIDLLEEAHSGVASVKDKQTTFWPKDFISENLLTTRAQNLIRALLLAMERNGDAMTIGPDMYEIQTRISRQYLWDELAEKWVVVDAE